jgi:hypothetical protein
VLRLARDAWWACSGPSSFFRQLEGEEPRVGRAVTAAFASVALACAVLALAFVRLTASDGYLVVLALTLALLLPLTALLVLLGGLAVVRPAALEVRAWEVVAWAYAPAGALALSLLPVTPFFPGPSAAALVVGFPIWHLVLLAAGLRSMASRPRAAFAWYVGALAVVPLLLTFIGVSVVVATP